MRKAVCIMAAVLCILPGCKKKQDVQNYRSMLDHPFEMTGIIQQMDQEFVLRFIRQPQGSSQVIFEGPGSLKGMRMFFDAEQITVEYAKLSFSFAPGTLPQAAPAALILQVVDAALSEESGATLTPDGIVVCGMIEQTSFSLLLDPQNGKILKLEIPERELEFKPLYFQFSS